MSPRNGRFDGRRAWCLGIAQAEVFADRWRKQMSDEELSTRARLRIGTTLKGKYKLDRVLGVGGMAVVYAATHRNRNRVAVNP